MAQRRFRTPAKNIAKSEQAKEEPSQQYHADTGPYLLQIDGQTKRSFMTFEAAHSAALELKTRFPVLQVSIYDTASNLRTVVNERSRSQSRTNDT
jgi:hypothetical protein